MFKNQVLFSFSNKLKASRAYNFMLLSEPRGAHILLILLAVLTAVILNWHVRDWQYDVWAQNEQTFHLKDGTRLVTTTDASYFLGVARSIKQGKSIQEYESSRNYPNRLRPDIALESSPKAAMFKFPLLSVLIAGIASDSSPKELLEAGHLLVLVTAALTALMISISFGVSGYWILGAVAAMGAGLCYAYLPRTGAGRIDTDQLNLGFFYLSMGLSYLTSQSKKTVSAILFSSLAGITMFLFCWWYQKPIFALLFLLHLTLLSFIAGRQPIFLLLKIVPFIILSGVLTQDISFTSSYLTENIQQAKLVLPNAHSTITELRKIDFFLETERMLGSIFLLPPSLIGLACFAILRPLKAIAFTPVFGFWVLSDFVGNRTLFFVAPLLWFGVGWFTHQVFNLLLVRFKALTPLVPQLSTVLISTVLVYTSSPVKYVQAPTFTPEVIDGFSLLKGYEAEERALLITWWDYGYAANLFGDFVTLHDPGVQNSLSTHLIASSLLSDKPSEVQGLYNLFSHDDWPSRLQSFDTAEEMSSYLSGIPRQKTDLNTYVFVSEQMEDWMISIGKLGFWDPFAGTPTRQAELLSNYGFFPTTLKCESMNSNEVVTCGNNKIDLKRGQINNLNIVSKIVVTQDGSSTGRRIFNQNENSFVVHIKKSAGKADELVLVSAKIFASLLYQLLHFGPENNFGLELVIDAYPSHRIFKLT